MSSNANGQQTSDVFSGIACTMVIMIISYEPSISLHIQMHARDS